jgi:hypothetical protein
VPASVYGFCVTGSGILFSGAVGTLIDKHDRLNIVRAAAVGQKMSSGTTYALFLLYFLTPLVHDGRMNGRSLVAYVAMVLCGVVLKVSTVCLTISIERDWASTIGAGSSQRLTKLNAWIRRIVGAVFLFDTGDFLTFMISLGSHMRSRFSTVRFWPFSRDKLFIRCGIPGWHDSPIVIIRGAFLIFECTISAKLTSAVI